MHRSIIGAGVVAAFLVPAVAQADSLEYIKGGNVWISHTDGTGARQVTTGTNWQYPSQADDGTLFAAGGAARVNSDGSDSDGSSEIYHFDQSGTPIGKPVETPGSRSTPSCPTYAPQNMQVSPDGTKVAYNLAFCGFGVDAFWESLSDAKFKMVSEDYHTSNWNDNGHFMLTHTGVPFGNAAFASYVIDNPDSTHGPADDPYFDDYTAVTPRDGSRVAVYESDPLIDGSGVASADIVLYSTTGGDVSHPTEKCKVKLDAATAQTGLLANPTFSHDGSRMAWGAKDGIHALDTSNLDACGTPTLLVAGASQPSFGPADVQPARTPAPTPTAAPTRTPAPGPTVTPTPTATPTVTPGTFTLSSPTAHATLTRTGRLAFTLSSTQAGSATVSGTIGHRHFATRTLTVGARSRVVLRMSRKNAKRVRRALKHRALTASISVVVTAAGGASAARQIAIAIGR